MCNFVDTHAHSTYSALDGYGTPKQIVARLKEIGSTASGITDHGTVAGHLEFYHEMTKAGLKPLLGCEFYHREDMRAGADEEETITYTDKNGKERKRKQRPEISHITVISKNNVGYQNLLKLSRASFEEGFRYKPTVDWPEIIKRQEGNHIFTGCVMGMLSRQINSGKEDLAFKWLGWLSQRIENLSVEIIPCPDLPISVIACQALWRMAEELDLPLIVTSDAHFPRPEDYQYQDTMLCISTNAKIHDENRGKDGGPIKLPEYHYLSTGEQILERCKRTLPLVPTKSLERAIERSLHIADSCNVELPRSRGPIYAIPKFTPDGEPNTPNAQLRQWVHEGREYRRSLGLLPSPETSEWEEYVAREKREWEIIEFHGFENYFLIVTDIVRWSLGQKKLCIARGSCGGSLICWYLGITQVDPVLFDLPVERFIDETRPDLPDIDLDFDSRYRDEVFEYLADKYGRDRCAKIMAFSYYRGRAAIKDVGNAYNIPPHITNKLAEMIPQSLDADEGMKVDNILERVLYDESNYEIQSIVSQYPAFKLAAELEGQIRQTTKHAAGVIIDAEPLANTVGVVAKPGEIPIVSCDKSYAAKQGLLKIDCLSVSEYAVIAETLEGAGKDFAWLFSLPLDDAATYEMVGKGKSAGVFQLQGGAATKILKSLRPTNIEEFVSISALARPGPMQSGGLEEYINRKYGREDVPDYHPEIMKIVGKTYGVIIYQEQVMWVARFIGGIEWKYVHKIRKIITERSGANQVAVYFPDYLKHATEVVGCSETEAYAVWEQCLKAGNYVFNRAHVVQYGVVGYWSAYLKKHYPALFAMSSCKYVAGSNVAVKKMKISKLLGDFRESGGKMQLLHPNFSKANFAPIDSQTIVGGFQNLHGVGAVGAATIEAGQPYSNWEQFYEYLESHKLKKIAEALRLTGVHANNINPTAALQIAPWYVHLEFSEKEQRFFEMKRCIPIGKIAVYFEEGEILKHVSIGGKVTNLLLIDTRKEAKKYNRPMPAEGEPYIRAQITVTDETGSIDVFFSKCKWEKLLQTRKGDFGPFGGEKGDGVGNGVYVSGVMSDDGARIWGEDFLTINAARMQK